MVRGVQLGPRRRRPLPAQPPLLDRRRLAGVVLGAHSHVGGVRWWNVKHPAAYADRLAAAQPAHAREVLDTESRRVERVLLELRLRDGLPTGVLDGTDAAVTGLADVGCSSRTTSGCSPATDGCSPMPRCATCCRERQWISRIVTG